VSVRFRAEGPQEQEEKAKGQALANADGIRRRSGANNMDSFFMQVFLNEVATQSDFALRAMDSLRKTMDAGDTRGVFWSAQAFLGATGNVSKLLWPSATKYSGRGNELREALGVSDDSPVASRTFRNRFEHFDEHLEGWAAKSKSHNFVDSNIAGPGAIGGINPEDFLRNLDPTTLNLTFHGDSYDLRTVEAALRKIHETARAKLERQK
jgi:hypothetical protein